MTEAFNRKALRRLPQRSAMTKFARFDFATDTARMMKNAPYLIEQNADARAASLAGTRQLIADDQFNALVALLVDCNAVPRAVMAATLKRLADGMIAKARGELETEWRVYPAELFDRARKLDLLAARLHS